MLHYAFLHCIIHFTDINVTAINRNIDVFDEFDEILRELQLPNIFKHFFFCRENDRISTKKLTAFPILKS